MTTHNDSDLIGTCDTCETEYDVSSRDGRCGDCGECSVHCTHTERLPERINVMLVRTYDVAKVIDDLMDTSEIRRSEITIDDITNHIEMWAREDFGDNYGETIWQDENGEEIPV